MTRTLTPELERLKKLFIVDQETFTVRGCLGDFGGGSGHRRQLSERLGNWARRTRARGNLPSNRPRYRQRYSRTEINVSPDHAGGYSQGEIAQ